MKNNKYSPIVEKLLIYGVLEHHHGEDCGHDHDHGDCGHDHHHHDHDHSNCGHDHHHDHDHGGCGHDHHHGEGCEHDHDYQPEWDNYLELGFTEEHIPELEKMLFDNKLHHTDADETAAWGPIHALRTIGQIKSADGVLPILKAMEKYLQDEWIIGDGMQSIIMIGLPALPQLAKTLHQDKKPEFLKMLCCEIMVNIAFRNKETTEVCKTLAEKLKKYAENHRDLNGFVVGGLVALKAKEYYDLIKLALEKNHTNEQICGDLEDIEVEFGMREKRSTKPHYHNSVTDKEIDNMQKNSKSGRNDSCPCGSGKKYKKCCMDKES